MCFPLRRGANFEEIVFFLQACTTGLLQGCHRPETGPTESLPGGYSGSRGTQDGLQMGPRWSQGGPEVALDGTMMPPKWPKGVHDGLSWPNMAENSINMTPKWPKNGPALPSLLFIVCILCLLPMRP